MKMDNLTCGGLECPDDARGTSLYILLGKHFRFKHCAFGQKYMQEEEQSISVPEPWHRKPCFGRWRSLISGADFLPTF